MSLQKKRHSSYKKRFQQNVQDKEELSHSLTDQIDVLETQRSIDAEENIPNKSDCNVPLMNTVQEVNDPPPPFSEFEILEMYRHIMRIREEDRIEEELEKELRWIRSERERIQKERQDIDNRNTERKRHKNMCEFSGLMVFIITCFKNVTLGDIMTICGLMFILTVFWKSIDMLFPLSPNVRDKVFLSMHNKNCDNPACLSETCKQIRYAGYRRKKTVFYSSSVKE